MAWIESPLAIRVPPARIGWGNGSGVETGEGNGGAGPPEEGGLGATGCGLWLGDRSTVTRTSGKEAVSVAGSGLSELAGWKLAAEKTPPTAVLPFAWQAVVKHASMGTGLSLGGPVEITLNVEDHTSPEYMTFRFGSVLQFQDKYTIPEV
jgi:hypothetical protein